MAISISQMLSVSYPEVLADMRKPENLWSESAFLNELERGGYIEKINGSNVIEVPLDYAANAGAEFESNDMTQVSLNKTDVLTSAQYASAQLQVPIVWSKKDEAENSSTNQKVSLVKALLENAINSHDDLIEQALFASSTSGFLGLPGMLNETDGTGVVGGIDTTDIPYWKNVFDATGWASGTIVAVLTAAFNAATLGTGSALTPKLIVSDAATQAVYEATQQGLRQYVDTNMADAGFKKLAFKTAGWVFSQYGTDTIYMLNPKSFRLMTVKQAFRLMGDTIEIPDQAGYIRKIFTLAQTKTNNRRRLVAIKAA